MSFATTSARSSWVELRNHGQVEKPADCLISESLSRIWHHNNYFLGCAVTWMTFIMNHIIFNSKSISPLQHDFFLVSGVTWIINIRSDRIQTDNRDDDKNMADLQFDLSKKTGCICCEIANVRTIILMFGTVLYLIIANTIVWVFYLHALYLTGPAFKNFFLWPGVPVQSL